MKQKVYMRCPDASTCIHKGCFHYKKHTLSLKCAISCHYSGGVCTLVVPSSRKNTKLIKDLVTLINSIDDIEEILEGNKKIHKINEELLANHLPTIDLWPKLHSSRTVRKEL